VTTRPRAVPKRWSCAPVKWTVRRANGERQGATFRDRVKALNPILKHRACSGLIEPLGFAIATAARRRGQGGDSPTSVLHATFQLGTTLPPLLAEEPAALCAANAGSYLRRFGIRGSACRRLRDPLEVLVDLWL